MPKKVQLIILNYYFYKCNIQVNKKSLREKFSLSLAVSLSVCPFQFSQSVWKSSLEIRLEDEWLTSVNSWAEWSAPPFCSSPPNNKTEKTDKWRDVKLWRMRRFENGWVLHICIFIGHTFDFITVDQWSTCTTFHCWIRLDRREEWRRVGKEKKRRKKKKHRPLWPWCRGCQWVYDFQKGIRTRQSGHDDRGHCCYLWNFCTVCVLVFPSLHPRTPE